MRKFLILLLSLLLLASVDAFAVVVNDINYKLDTLARTAAVASNSGSSGDIIIPETITYEGKTYRVTSIGEGAFAHNNYITSVVIGNEVEKINMDAFEGCTALKSVTIGSKVTSLWYAFYGCTALEEVHINNLAAWCNMVFDSDPYASTNVKVFDSNPLYYAKHLFMNGKEVKELVIPNGVTKIGDECFANCESLTSLIIPNSVTEIGKAAFAGCNFETVKIGDGIKNIRADAFHNSDNIQDFYCYAEEIPEVDWPTLQSFNRWLYSIKTLHVPATSVEAYKSAWGAQNVVAIDESVDSVDIVVDSIHYRLFMANKTAMVIQSEDGQKPGDIVIPQSVPYEGEHYFVKSVGEKAFYASRTLTSVSIAEGVEQISTSAFLSCANLRSVTLPESVTKIGKTAFGWCQKLSSITIPSRVTTIDDYAFYACKRLLYANVPQQVTIVGRSLFGECTSLASVVWEASVNVPEETFTKVENPNLLLYVSEEKYAAAVDSVVNVVTSGHAGNIVLKEEHNFYALQPFFADEISYTHHYTMQSGYKECRGWETLALPFDVETVTHESAGALVPFALYQTAVGMRPFWLGELTSEGWLETTKVEANKPYIISMPNNSVYSEEYCLVGYVTFSAHNVTVPKTEPLVGMSVSEAGQSKFVPTTWNVDAANEVYAINQQEFSGYPEGSVFVANLRDIRPFEAYYITSPSGAKQRNIIPITDIIPVTGLSTIGEDHETTVSYYTLDGRKVTNPSVPGIYIVSRGRSINKIRIY